MSDYKLLPAPIDIDKDETKDVDTDWSKKHKEREETREEIRSRVRKATSHNEYFRPAKPSPTIQDETDKKVAVYARVSTLSTDQTSSIENQTQYYTKKIAENPHWELEEIYSDEGKSGTSLRHRDEFNRMMENAEKQKMDLILCASVSRFARNISDCLDQVGKLKTMNPAKPIGVYFETENIYTLDPNSDQSLHMHAMLADWESANKSRRMILSYDQRILTGQYPVMDLLGFRHTKDGQLIIEPEEAKTVRFIFLAYITGYSKREIAEILTEKGRPTLKGRTEWNSAMVDNIMRNERVWGDLEARKSIVIDYKRGIVIRNTGQRDSAYVPNHHEGIVSPAIAKAAHSLSSSYRGLREVPELTVITSGTLKGFVSMHPGWKGIDAETLREICLSVYTEKELQTLFKEARIMEGSEHSNVFSFELSGYQVPPGIVFLNSRMPSVTIFRGGMRFSKATLEALDRCDYIDILYHPVYKILIIKRGSEERVNSVRWISSNGRPKARISAIGLSNAIYEENEWKNEFAFKFRGITKERGSQKFIYFLLDEPLIIPNQDNGEETQEVQYVSYKVRESRNDVIKTVSENELNENGITVVNPYIGTIPSREELEEELESLLKIM